VVIGIVLAVEKINWQKNIVSQISSPVNLAQFDQIWLTSCSRVCKGFSLIQVFLVIEKARSFSWSVASRFKV
jgi:hypothetical protein